MGLSLPFQLNAGLLINLVLFVVGILIGVGIAKAIKGLLLVIIGVLILAMLGITVAGLFNLSDLWSVLGPLKDMMINLAKGMAEYPAISVGLLIGLVVGLIR